MSFSRRSGYERGRCLASTTSLPADPMAGVLHVAIAAVSFFGAGAVVGAGARLWGLGRTQLMLRLAYGEPLDVVVSTTSASRHGAAAPSDRLVTNRGSLNALMACAETVGALHRRKEVRVHLSRQPTADLTEDLVLLGGNNENPQAQDLIDAVRLNCPQAGFCYDDRDEDHNFLALDGRTYSYPWSALARDRQPDHDFGVVVLWVNPGATDRRRRAIFCAAFTAAGTEALARDFFGGGARRVQRNLGPRNALRGVWRMICHPRRRPCFIAVYRIGFGDGDGDAPRIEPIDFRRIPDVRCGELARPESLVELRDAATGPAAIERAQIGALLAAAFGADAVQGEDFTQRAPAFRFVALLNGAVVGHVGVVDLTPGRPLCVLGISDLVVDKGLRRLGFGEHLLERAIQATRARGADVTMIATESPHLLPILDRAGFRPAPEGLACYRDPATGRPRHNAAWRWRIEGGSMIAPPFEIDGDF
jgi:predicted N-acetyltransferase YhbS